MSDRIVLLDDDRSTATRLTNDLL